MMMMMSPKDAMERVTTKQAAKELNMDIVNLQYQLRNGRLPIGYTIEKEGAKRTTYIIEHAQTEITREESRKKQDRKYERRRKQLEDRIENTEELDQKRMVNWADRKLFKNRHMLYYKKRGRYAEVCCSACGGVYRYAWKQSQSYEGQFEKIIEEPVAKRIGTCEMCGERGIYQQQGRAGISKEECIHIFAASRFKEKGAVIRYIAMYKEWVLEQIEEKDKVVMHGAYGT